MNNLSAFLDVAKEENLKFIASNRFNDKDGKPVEWEIKCLTAAEDEEVRKACVKRVAIPGKRNQFTNETDYDLYLGRLAAKCTVEPNLDSKELQDNYRVMGADILLKTMLKPGEYADFLAKVQEINGFDISIGDLVDHAKN